MADSLFNGTVVHATTSNVVGPVSLPLALSEALAAEISSTYAATSATTGVKLQVSVSIDGGVTYSDFADLVTTAPTPSSGSATTSVKFASLSAYLGATNLKFNLVNLDGTNDATVTVTLRTAV